MDLTDLNLWVSYDLKVWIGQSPFFYFPPDIFKIHQKK